MKTNIIMIKYEDNSFPRVFGGKEYYYYTNKKLNVDDLVEAPTKFGLKVAKVTRINVSEKEIEKVKPYMKTIIRQINRDRYINFAEIEEVAS